MVAFVLLPLLAPFLCSPSRVNWPAAVVYFLVPAGSSTEILMFEGATSLLESAVSTFLFLLTILVGSSGGEELLGAKTV